MAHTRFERALEEDAVLIVRDGQDNIHHEVEADHKVRHKEHGIYPPPPVIEHGIYPPPPVKEHGIYPPPPVKEHGIYPPPPVIVYLLQPVIV